jgi:PRTRC genetic system protein B
VNDSGYVCLGSTRVPQQGTVNSLPLWEKAFFESEFTHPNAANRLTLHPGGFVGLWKSLVGKKRFPTEHLAEAKESLSQFINRSHGV